MTGNYGGAWVGISSLELRPSGFNPKGPKDPIIRYLGLG